MITYSTVGTPNHALGTVATYSCNVGFVLDLTVGSEMRTCEDDGMDAFGMFSGQAPSCVRKFKYRHRISFNVVLQSSETKLPGMCVQLIKYALL